MSKYEVQTRFGDSWENVWCDTDENAVETPLRFATIWEAEEEIADFMEECEVMESDFDRNDYRIVEVLK